jgi:ribonuclease VapC
VVVDTSALMAVVLGEPDAERYAASLAAAPRLLIAAPTWLEAAIVATARLGPEGHALLTELLEGLQATVVPFDEVLARSAHDGWLRFGRGRHPAGLNLGDCFAYALAKQCAEPLLFKGEDFARTDLEAAL